MFSFSTPYQTKCVTKISPHWSSTMDPVCAKPDLPEMMHPGPSSRLSSADPDIRCVSVLAGADIVRIFGMNRANYDTSTKVGM